MKRSEIKELIKEAYLEIIREDISGKKVMLSHWKDFYDEIINMHPGQAMMLYARNILFGMVAKQNEFYFYRLLNSRDTRYNLPKESMEDFAKKVIEYIKGYEPAYYVLSDIGDTGEISFPMESLNEIFDTTGLNPVRKDIGLIMVLILSLKKDEGINFVTEKGEHLWFIRRRLHGYEVYFPNEEDWLWIDDNEEDKNSHFSLIISKITDGRDKVFFSLDPEPNDHSGQESFPAENIIKEDEENEKKIPLPKTFAEILNLIKNLKDDKIIAFITNEGMVVAIQKIGNRYRTLVSKGNNRWTREEGGEELAKKHAETLLNFDSIFPVFYMTDDDNEEMSFPAE